MRPDFANKLDFLWLSLIEMWVGVERGFLFLNEKLECFLVGSVWHICQPLPNPKFFWLQLSILMFPIFLPSIMEPWEPELPFSLPNFYKLKLDDLT